VIQFTYETGDGGAKTVEEHELLQKLPNITLLPNQSFSVTFNLTALNAGHINLGINSSSSELEK